MWTAAATRADASSSSSGGGEGGGEVVDGVGEGGGAAVGGARAEGGRRAGRDAALAEAVGRRRDPWGFRRALLALRFSAACTGSWTMT